MILQKTKIQAIESVTVVQFATEGELPIEVLPGGAHMEEALEVTEVDEDGSVNHLVAHNKSDKFLFLTDGDLLMGAKQNRVLNASILLAPNSKYVIDVSCVEQGRWSHRSAKFSSSDDMADYALRAKKSRRVSHSLNFERGHQASQGEVWGDVQNFLLSTDSSSPTSDYLKHMEDIKGRVERKRESVKLDEQANGIAIFIGKKLVGMDVFGNREIYRHYFPKLLSAALRMTASEKLESPEENELLDSLMDALSDTRLDQAPVQKGMCEGTERRAESPRGVEFELAYEQCTVHRSLVTL